MREYLRGVNREWNSVTLTRRWPMTYELAIISALGFRDDRPFIGGFAALVLALRWLEFWVLERRLAAELAAHHDGSIAPPSASVDGCSPPSSGPASAGLEAEGMRLNDGPEEAK